LLIAAGFAQGTSRSSRPQFTQSGELVLPAGYREWVFLSSGLGMTYNPAPSPNPSPRFTNVFVPPAAYRSFLRSGKWPNKTMLVLEIRSSSSAGSINTGGYYQSDVAAIEVEVKDTTRFPANGWAFFAFGKSNRARDIPRTAACYACHSEHGAADNTFVQFYPELLAIAKQKGTLNPAYRAAPSPVR
jgi:Cytochrome P460